MLHKQNSRQDLTAGVIRINLLYSLLIRLTVLREQHPFHTGDFVYKFGIKHEA